MNLKRILLVSLVIIGLVTSSDAQRPLLYTGYDTEQITVAATAIGFTASKTKPVGEAYQAALASCSAECSASAPCPYRYNSVTGVTPTASVGLLININATTEEKSFAVYGYENIRAFKAIRTGANSVKLSCTYYK